MTALLGLREAWHVRQVKNTGSTARDHLANERHLSADPAAS